MGRRRIHTIRPDTRPPPFTTRGNGSATRRSEDRFPADPGELHGSRDRRRSQSENYLSEFRVDRDAAGTSASASLRRRRSHGPVD